MIPRLNNRNLMIKMFSIFIANGSNIFKIEFVVNMHIENASRIKQLKTIIE